VSESADRGASFNYLAGPDFNNIAIDAPYFMTTWSPGQFFFASTLQQLGLSLGLSVAVIVAVFSIIGLVGWHTLYRAFQFPELTVTLSLTAIVLSRFFAYPFGIYDGAEVILFGLAPWATLFFYRTTFLSWLTPVIIVAVLSFLAFCKLSGVLFGFSVLAAGALAAIFPLRRDSLRVIGLTSVGVVLFGVLFYWYWLSRGWTAASGNGEVNVFGFLAYLPLAASMTFGSSIAIGDFLARVFLFPGHKLLTTGISGPLYVLSPFAGALILALWKYLKNTHVRYIRFALGACVLYILFMAAIDAHGGEVSLEERHFRYVSLLLMVGFIHLALITPSIIIRFFALVVFGGLMLYGSSSYLVRAKANLARPMSIRGFRHETLVEPLALEFIHTVIDTQNPGAEPPLVLVTSSDVALEFRNARVIYNHADFEPDDYLRAQSYHGRVRALYVLVQTKLVENGKADIIKRSFVDYPVDGWQRVDLGSFSCFFQVN
jgi:hypothetical protein